MIIFMFSHVVSLITIVILDCEYIGTTSISSVPVGVSHGLCRYLLIGLSTTLGGVGIDLVEVGGGAQLARLLRQVGVGTSQPRHRIGVCHLELVGLVFVAVACVV